MRRPLGAQNKGTETMKRLYLIAILLFILSCTGYKVITIPNSGKYQNIHRMSGNFLPVEKKYLGIYGNFEISGEVRFNNDKNKREYSLIVAGLIRDGLNIKKGKSLLLNIDGENIEFVRRDKPYIVKKVKMNRQKYILELAWYDISKEILNKISNAKKIEFTVYGKDKFIKGKFNRNNIKNFSNFYSNYVYKIK